MGCLRPEVKERVPDLPAPSPSLKPNRGVSEMDRTKRRKEAENDRIKHKSSDNKSEKNKESEQNKVSTASQNRR